MASIKEISLSNIRNIDNLNLIPDAGINIIQGNNGAGKTSILEAIHVLSTSRSFRSNKIRHVIKHNQKSLIVAGKVKINKTIIPVGIERSVESIHARLSLETINNISTITKTLPVLVMHPTSYTLLTGEPGLRRSFIDWGAFHCYTAFNTHRKQYNRTLLQRNAVLKQRGKSSDVTIWDNSLVKYAEDVDKIRNAYLEELSPYIKSISQQLDPENVVSIKYRSGWNKEKSLGSVLGEQLERDKHAGYTWSGPHRADLTVKLNNYMAKEIASRGQLKLITLILLLAQAFHYRTKKGVTCILLLDDLPSEFDEKHLMSIMELVKASNSQSFITMIESNKYPDIKHFVGKVFHVKRGDIVVKE